MSNAFERERRTGNQGAQTTYVSGGYFNDLGARYRGGCLCDGRIIGRGYVPPQNGKQGFGVIGRFEPFQNYPGSRIR